MKNTKNKIIEPIPETNKEPEKVKRDFRSLDEKTQAEFRRLAFEHLDEGMLQYKVAKIIGVCKETINDWVAKRKEIEARDYKGMKRGRLIDEQKVLSKEQEEKIKKDIIEKTPLLLDMPYALWNRKAIQQCIKKETGKTVYLQTVSKYTKRWGLTPQRPAKYACEQDPEKITTWLKVTFPLIKEQAKKENAEIHWSDETAISFDTWYQRTYSPAGKTPVIKLPARKGHISVIASISNHGDLKFMTYKGGLDSDMFITFLKRLIHDVEKKKIYLIVDNLRVHKSKKVMAWVELNSKRISLFFPTSLCSTIQSRRVTQ